MANGGQLAQATAVTLLRRKPLALLIVLFALIVFPPHTARAQPQIATLVADSISIDAAGRLIAEGAVEVWQGTLHLRATRAIYDPQSEGVELVGPLVLSDGPNRVVLMDQAELSRDLQDGILMGARFVLDQRLQITAARAERRGREGTAQLQRVAATTCETCTTNPVPMWEIRAAQVELDENAQRIRFRHAEFRFRGVPLIGLPSANMPMPGVTRARGPLVPLIDFNGALGFRVGVPWFLPIGDHRDLTLTPSVYSSGAGSLGFRYRAAHQSGGVQVTGLVATDRIIPGAIRGFLRVNGLYALPQDFRLTFEGTWVSDRTLAANYVLPIPDRIANNATIERIRRDQMIRLRAMALRTFPGGDVNSQDPLDIFQAGIDQRFGLGHTALGGSAWVTLDAESFRRPSSLNALGRDAIRARLRLGWQRQETLIGGLRLRLATQGEGLAARYYEDAAFPAPITHLGGQAMVELRWPVARVSASGARQVVEPIAQLIWGTPAPNLPNDDHRMPELDGANLFSLNRYSGFDGADTGTRANVGLAFSHFNPQGWTVDMLAGRVLRLQALPGFAPAHRQPLGALNSDWFLGLSAELPGRLRTGLAVTLDDAGTLSRGQAGLQWTGDTASFSTSLNHLPSLPQERRIEPITAWSTDMSYNFTEGWTARLGWSYHLLGNHTNNARAGVTYRNECLLFDAGLQQSFVGPNNTLTETSFVVRVELLGLTGAPPPGRRACRI